MYLFLLMRHVFFCHLTAHALAGEEVSLWGYKWFNKTYTAQNSGSNLFENGFGADRQLTETAGSCQPRPKNIGGERGAKRK